MNLQNQATPNYKNIIRFHFASGSSAGCMSLFTVVNSKLMGMVQVI